MNQQFEPQQVPVGTNGEETDQKHVKLRIVKGETGACFFVTGVNGNEEIKNKIKELNGHYNAHAKGYKFRASQLEEVVKQLGLDSNIELDDPRKMVTVNFTQQFKWNGNMEDMDKQLKAIGMVKNPKTKDYTADLSKVNDFFKLFNIQ